MSRFDSLWTQRAAISVDNITGVLPADPFSVVIPEDFDRFWTKVDATLDDLVITDARGANTSGSRIPSSQVEAVGLDYANRVLTLEVDPTGSLESFDDSVTTYWMYWGNGAAADPPTGTVGLSLTGYVELACADRNRLVVVRPELVGEVVPRQKFSKTSESVMDIWFGVDAIMAQRCSPFAGSRQYEEVHGVRTSIEDAGTLAVVETGNRIIDGFVRCRISGGTDGDDQTLQLFIETSNQRKFTARAQVSIRDVVA